MMPPTSIDGTDITGATIDGTDVTEITVDGQTVFSAGPNVQIVDDFERSNPLDDYAFSGGTLNSSTVWNGSNSYNCDGGGRDVTTGTFPNTLPTKGDAIGWLVNFNALDNLERLMFKASDTNNYDSILLEVRDASGNFHIAGRDGGSFTGFKDSATVSWSTGEWYYVIARFHDGSGSESDNTIEAELYDNVSPGSSLNLGSLGSPIATLSATAENNSGDKIGFANRDICVVDFVHIRKPVGDPDA